METESEFRETGKKMPYSVPEGFFDRITEKTLEKARNREKIRRKNVIMWYSMTVAASVGLIFAIGLLIFSPSPDKHTEQTARNIPGIFSPEVPNRNPVVITDHQPEKPGIAQEIPDKKANTVPSEKEDINEVLSALSNDEVLQLATIYKTDIFLDETENNLQ